MALSFRSAAFSEADVAVGIEVFDADRVAAAAVVDIEDEGARLTGRTAEVETSRAECEVMAALTGLRAIGRESLTLPFCRGATIDAAATAAVFTALTALAVLRLLRVDSAP